MSNVDGSTEKYLIVFTYFSPILITSSGTSALDMENTMYNKPKLQNPHLALTVPCKL